MHRRQPSSVVEPGSTVEGRGEQSHAPVRTVLARCSTLLLQLFVVVVVFALFGIFAVTAFLLLSPPLCSYCEEKKQRKLIVLHYFSEGNFRQTLLSKNFSCNLNASPAAILCRGTWFHRRGKRRTVTRTR